MQVIVIPFPPIFSFPRPYSSLSSFLLRCGVALHSLPQSVLPFQTEGVWGIILKCTGTDATGFRQAEGTATTTGGHIQANILPYYYADL